MKKCSYTLIIILVLSLSPIDSTYAAPESYPPCSYTYKIEGDKVFRCKGYEGEVEVLGADAATFEEVGHQLAKDAKHVYCEENILEADVAAFKAIEPPSSYYKDARSVFYNCSKMEDADPLTFRRIESLFSRDENSVYYQGFLLDADPSSFQILKHGYSKDASKVFFTDKEVPDANAVSFQVRDYGDYTKYCDSIHINGWDAKHYFYNGMLQNQCELSPAEEDAPPPSEPSGAVTEIPNLVLPESPSPETIPENELMSQGSVGKMNEIQLQLTDERFAARPVFNGPITKTFRALFKLLEIILGINIF